MKAIHMFYRRFNFNSTLPQRGKCKTSLMHSLRLKKNNTKKFQWDDQLADENLIFLGGKVQKLSDFSEDDKLELLYSITPNPPVRNKRKHQNTRRKYKLKLRKAIESEIKKGHIEAANFMRLILTFDDNKFISYAKLEQFKAFDMTRKNQRIKMLETYIESHNLLTKSVPNENAVYVQEGLFLIPHQWGIGTDVINKESYITIVRDFLLHHFADYPIETIICHHDERSLNENTGAHSHYFLSGRNNKTGCYDLHKTQIKIVNAYIKQHGDIDDRLPDDGQLNRMQSKVFGEWFQHMFYDFINEKLLRPKGLIAVFSDETVRKSVQRRKMNQESKLPKSERSYNYQSRQIEIEKNILNELFASRQKEETVLSHLRDDINSEKNRLETVLAQKQEVSEQLILLNQKARENTEEIQAYEIEIDKLILYSTGLNNEETNTVLGICKALYVRTAASERGLDETARKYALDILASYQRLLRPQARAICEAAARALDDDLLNIAKGDECQFQQDIELN